MFRKNKSEMKSFIGLIFMEWPGSLLKIMKISFFLFRDLQSLLLKGVRTWILRRQLFVGLILLCCY